MDNELVVKIILQFLVFGFCISIGIGCVISAFIMKKELTKYTFRNFLFMGSILVIMAILCFTKFADYSVYFQPLNCYLPIFLVLLFLLFILIYKFNIKLFIDNIIEYHYYCKKICKYIESFEQNKKISKKSKFVITKIIEKLEDSGIMLNLETVFKLHELKNKLSDYRLTYGELRNEFDKIK